jgi:hypothetical protein
VAEFEEVPGPEPDALRISSRGGGHAIATHLDVVFVSANPWSGETGVL